MASARTTNISLDWKMMKCVGCLLASLWPKMAVVTKSHDLQNTLCRSVVCCSANYDQFIVVLMILIPSLSFQIPLFQISCCADFVRIPINSKMVKLSLFVGGKLPFVLCWVKFSLIDSWSLLLERLIWCCDRQKQLQNPVKNAAANEVLW